MGLALTLLIAAQEFPGAIQPHVALGPKKTAYVVMIREGNIKVAASADGGETFGEPLTAIDGGGRKIPGGLRRGPRIGVDKKGALVVTAPICFDKAEFSKRYPIRQNSESPPDLSYRNIIVGTCKHQNLSSPRIIRLELFGPRL